MHAADGTQATLPPLRLDTLCMQRWQPGRTLVVASARRLPRVLACRNTARTRIIALSPLVGKTAC